MKREERQNMASYQTTWIVEWKKTRGDDCMDDQTVQKEEWRLVPARVTYPIQWSNWTGIGAWSMFMFLPLKKNEYFCEMPVIKDA